MSIHTDEQTARLSNIMDIAKLCHLKGTPWFTCVFTVRGWFQKLLVTHWQCALIAPTLKQAFEEEQLHE